jgi:electron transfer flavoprotein alpha subunit
MNILVIAEHDQQQIKPATLKTITAAQQIGNNIAILVVGYQCQAAGEAASKIDGIQKVIVADHQCYDHQLAENVAPLISKLATDYAYILAPATTFGKNIMPRVAALLDVAQVSDVIKIVDQNTYVRPIYAGNALATVQSQDPYKIITVRTTAFANAKTGSNSAPIENCNLTFDNAKTRFVKHELSTSARPELTAARVIVSGGRGMQSGENFKLLEQLADHLNAAIGASRAAVDAGFVPNDYQVGQTGKVVAPELYIAVGISGAIQHLAGMKDSKVIVAINKDPDAAIFQLADYGLVGDLFQILPQLIDELSRLKR